jgi:ATP-dependent exoDNAse (exonuclease V) beta subunit
LWDKKKEKLYITMPDGGDAIKIMTVHKAKGLKFEAVILDATSRGNKKSKSEYWTDIEIEGVEELKVGLFPITASLKKIGFTEVYEEEDEKTMLDFINMVYVAFTRPVSALFLFGHTGGRPEKFSEYLLKYLETKEDWQETSDEAYEIGELSQPIRKENSEEKEVLVLNKLFSSSWENQIRIAKADEVYWEAIDSKPARVYGNLIHTMLSKIITTDDVEDVVNAYQLSAVIDEQEAKEIREILLKVVSHPQLKHLFSKDVIVKNETEVLDPFSKSAAIQRPDRVVLTGTVLVVIDYKTGEKEKSHIKQLEQYGRVFQQLGYTKIDLKLVYISSVVEVIEVSPTTTDQPVLF